jgi:hypothetical protein
MRYLKIFRKYPEFPKRKPCDYCDGIGQHDHQTYQRSRSVSDPPEAIECNMCDGTGLERMGAPLVCKGRKL